MPSKQEEIREGVDSILLRAALEMGIHLNVVKQRLSDLGVVIQVERDSFASICGYCHNLDSCPEEHNECDKFRLSARYVVVESLIEEK